MSLSIVSGLPGSGKSLYQLQYGCFLANKLRCNLVSNIPFDFPALRKYCGMSGYGWLGHLIDRDKIIVIPGMRNVNQIFQHSNAVVLLDEAGVFFPARSFASLDKSVLVDLAQMRKGGLNIVAACQYFEQIDKAFRMLATKVVHSSGISTYSRDLKGPKLLIKNYYHFDPVTYEAWWGDKKARRPGIGGFLRTRLQYAQKCESKRISKIDLQAFKVFKSFDRLENASAYANPYYQEPYYEVSQNHKDSQFQTYLAARTCEGGDAAKGDSAASCNDSLFSF